MTESSARVSDRVIRSFIHELLVWNLSDARAEASSARAGQSTIIPVLTAIELGVVGYGCSGTKPVMAVNQDPELLHRFLAEPTGTRRYHTLTGRDLQTADAIIYDGKGDQLIEVTFGLRKIACTLAQRVGFTVVEANHPDKHRRWLGKIAVKDSTPALDGAEKLGTECLQSAAIAWFAIT